MNKIVTVANMTIDLSRIKALKINEYKNLGKTNIIIIEYDSKVEYSKNPFTGQIEKNIISDQVVKEFPDFDTAMAYRNEIEECWNDYMREA